MHLERHPHLSSCVVLLLVICLPAVALGRRGSAALVNMRTEGAELVTRANAALGSHVGGWATQPSIAAFLAGEPNPGALPSGDVGRDLSALVERIRSGKSTTRDLSELGRLLGVDYLLLLRVKAERYSAKLYSVGAQAYAPRSLESASLDLSLLKGYLKDQAGKQARPGKKGALSRWWIFAAAAALAGLTIGLALSSGDDKSGDVVIRAWR